MTRTLIGIVCGALTAALGAAVLGEYEFRGTLPFIAGPLFGLVIGEVLVAVGRTRTAVVGAIGAVFGFAALVWAGWVASGKGLQPLGAGVWVAASLAAITGYLRTAGLPSSSTPPG